MNETTSNQNPLTSQLWVVQPQIISLAVALIIIIIICLWVAIRLRKADPRKTSEGVVFVAEQYVTFFDNTMQGVMEGKLNWTSSYLFSVFTFLMLGNLISLLGFHAVATAFSIPMTFAIITWSLTYVVAFMFQKWRTFKRFLNPMDWVGQVTPLLSLSMRMFGNITSGSVILFLLYSLFGWIFSQIFGIESSAVNYVLAPIVTPLLHLYLDAFGALIQAYVFLMLSMLSWVNETQVHVDEKKLAKKLQKNKPKNLGHASHKTANSI